MQPKNRTKLRDIACQILTEMGYQVTIISSGEQAIKYIVTHSVDLLMLDMIVEPGIDGLQTYKKIKELGAAPKTLIVSGFAERKKVKEAISSGVDDFIKKPYTVKQIATVVKRCLAAE